MEGEENIMLLNASSVLLIRLSISYTEGPIKLNQQKNPSLDMNKQIFYLIKQKISTKLFCYIKNLFAHI